MSAKIRYDRIPNLKVQLNGSANYNIWAVIVRTDFRLHRVLDIAIGKEDRPNVYKKKSFKRKQTAIATTAETGESSSAVKTEDEITEEEWNKMEEDHENEALADMELWDLQNDWGVSYILHNVEPDILPTLTPYAGHLHDMWRAIEDKYDRKTTTTLLSLVKKINRLTYDESTPLSDHIAEFHRLWSSLLERTWNDGKNTGEIETVYFALVNSQQAKGQYLLMSLPPSFDNIVDNLTTKSDLAYADIYEKLMDIDTKRKDTNGKDKTAYFAKSGNQDNKKKPRECSYCTKQAGKPVLGHDSRHCFKLKKLKAKNSDDNNTKDKPSDTKAAEKNANHVTGTAFFSAFDVAFDYNDSIPNLYTEEFIDSGYSSDSSALATSTHSDPSSWIFDTGASDHISGRVELFTNLREQSGTITAAGGHKLMITGIGDVHLQGRLPDGTINPIVLHDVFLVPEAHYNLLSWKRIAKKGFSMSGTESDIKVFSGSVIVAWAVLNHQGNFVVQQESPIATLAKFDVWHQRLGHLPASALPSFKKMVADPEVLPTTGNMEHCRNCELGKAVQLPYKDTKQKSKGILEIIHSDLSGKFTTRTLGGKQYYITFIDDFSRMAFVYFLAKKKHAHQALVQFVNMIENQTGLRVKRLRSDNGGEYINASTSSFLVDKGIIHEMTAPYAHSSNGVAERFNRTIATMARTVVIEKGKFLWGEAIAAMTYVKNHLPHKFLVDRTPFEAFFGRKPAVRHLRTFGEKAFVHIPEETRPADSKLSPRAREGIFVGYTETATAFRIYLPNERKVVIARNVTFPVPSSGEDIVLWEEEESDHEPEKEETPQIPLPESPPPSVEEVPEDISDDGTITPRATRPPTPPPPRRSTRTRKQPDWYDPSVFSAFAVYNEPVSYKEAIDSEDASQWKVAMREELSSMDRNQTWEVVELPKGRKVVKCRWVYKVKLGPSGNIDRYKARLVAKGFTQVHGIDYDETFAPVSRYESIRLLLAISAQHGWFCNHMDVKSAFLNGVLKEEIYMAPPEGTNIPDDRVCRLKKCIYGLKQASREWYARLSDALHQNGFKNSDFDPCVFIHHLKGIVLGIYVDDILIFSENQGHISDTSDMLKSEFEMTDLGPADYALGISLTFEKDGIRLSQKAYLSRVLERFGMTDSRTVTTPLDPNQQLCKGTEEERIENPTLYQSIIGSLMYAVIGTRPDLAYSVTLLSQFSSCPNKIHLQAALRTLRYLKGTLDWHLFFPRSGQHNNTLRGFSDSDYAHDPDTRRSFTGNCFLYNECLISWNSQKQKTVAVSTTEAEYMALSNSSRQMIWLQRAIKNLGFSCSFVLFGDNNGSLSLARNPVQHKRSKHIDVHFHFIREKLEEGLFTLSYVPTSENVADLFTKALERVRHVFLSSLIHCGS